MNASEPQQPKRVRVLFPPGCTPEEAAAIIRKTAEEHGLPSEPKPVFFILPPDISAAEAAKAIRALAAKHGIEQKDVSADDPVIVEET